MLSASKHDSIIFIAELELAISNIEKETIKRWHPKYVNIRNLTQFVDELFLLNWFSKTNDEQ